MSTGPTPPTPPAPGAAAKPLPQEIKVVAHSSLLYWWPVWFFGFVFSLWTLADKHRMAILDEGSKVIVEQRNAEGEPVKAYIDPGEDLKTLTKNATKSPDNGNQYTFPIRVSPRAWMGPMFFLILFLVIIITNVPLRGLWSLVTIIGIVVIALILSLMEKWDDLLKAMGDLHIFMNLAGYLTLSVAIFAAWLIAVWVFDRRTYIIFTAGQVKVCEEIGGREKVYDTTNMTLEKHRDDWFRHIILGFGTGDLTVRAAGADRQQIVMPNVAFIGFKIDAIESMLRARQTTPKT